MSTMLHPDIKLGLIKINVSNLNRSIQFYKEVVGLQVLQINTTHAELTLDGLHPFLLLEEIPNAQVTPRRSAAGLYHFAILLPTRRDLGLSLSNLIQSGIHIGQADHLVSEALYITDPDNNGIEIYCDRPRDTWRRDTEGNYIMAADPIDWDGLLREAEGFEWNGLPEGTTLGHIHFHVKSLQTSKQFYCDTLGFDIVVDGSATMRALFISAGGYHHHIGLNTWAGEDAPTPPVNGTGLAYYTIIFPNQKALDETLERLQQASIRITRQEDGHFVTDPSGVRLQLVAIQ